MINAFMLEPDYALESFAKRAAAIYLRIAYFTTPPTLGKYVLIDSVDKKAKTVQ